MNENMKLPSEYTPYKQLIICSNSAVDYKVPIATKNHPTLLIGTGSVPQVWLAISNPENTEDWRYLVSKNKSLHPQIKVEVDKIKKSVVITAGSDEIIRAVQSNEEKSEILAMDLRPIGLNIHGDNTVLNIGGGTMKRGTFVSVNTVIGLG